MDNLSPQDRYKTMRSIRAAGTEVEYRVEYAIRKLTSKYRSQASLVGKPDFVLIDFKLVIFVHGCFWHGHLCRSTIPQTNSAYWKRKIMSNKKRDERVRRRLNRAGWSVAVIWECRAKTRDQALVAVLRALARTAANRPQAAWRCKAKG